MKVRFGHRDYIGNPFPIVIRLVCILAKRLALIVCIAKDAGTRSVDEVSRRSFPSQTCYDGVCGADVVGVRGMDYYVCFGGLGGEEVSTVKISVDEVDFGVLRSDFGTFVAIAGECGDFEIREGGCNRVESVTANVASGSSARGLLISIRYT